MFNRRMFILAKEAAGLTQGAIAVHAGVSQSLLSKIENGFEDPSDAFLEKAAEICGVPVAFFHQDDQILGESLVDLFHRRRKTLPAKPLRKANAGANVLRLEALRLLGSDPPEVPLRFPSFPIYESESPSHVAELVRASWRVPRGPIPNLVGLVEQTGTPVYLERIDHSKLRALSMPGVDSSHQFIVLNSDLPASLQRFSLAHELGHLVMHAGEANDDMEHQADEFAAAFLMPAEEVKPQLFNVKFRDLGALKAIWRVSLAALIYRAHELGQITDRHRTTLYMNLNKLPGGRMREPGEFPKEQPTLMAEHVAYLLNHLNYSVPELARLAICTEGDFRSRYLGDATPRLRVV